MTLLVTGAAGRLGRLLQLEWGDAGALWTARQAGPGVGSWDIGRSAPPALPPGAVVLHLAGAVRGDAARLATNAEITAEVCRVALQARARHVFLASTAAVYQPGPDDLSESMRPDPASPYGAAKLQAEATARRMLAAPDAPGLTILRIGNVAGADALLGGSRVGPVTLDPVPGQPGGPLRSYIGPGRLAAVLGALIARPSAELPPILNLAEPGVVAMADLLTAAGQEWHYGPPNPAVVPRVGLATGLLTRLVPMAQATAAGLVTDLRRFEGRWP